MTTLLYSLLILFGLISSPSEFDNLPVEEQEHLMIIITDEIL